MAVSINPPVNLFGVLYIFVHKQVITFLPFCIKSFTLTCHFKIYTPKCKWARLQNTRPLAIQYHAATISVDTQIRGHNCKAMKRSAELFFMVGIFFEWIRRYVDTQSNVI